MISILLTFVKEHIFTNGIYNKISPDQYNYASLAQWSKQTRLK